MCKAGQWQALYILNAVNVVLLRSLGLRGKLRIPSVSENFVHFPGKSSFCSLSPLFQRLSLFSFLLDTSWCLFLCQDKSVSNSIQRWPLK